MKSVEDIAAELCEMLNLVAFDVCEADSVRYIADADPLKLIVAWRLLAPIPQPLHAQIRATVRQTVESAGWASGKVVLDPYIEITLYKKRMRPPAYVHGESPQG